jgi:hypothetical protein
MAVVSCNQNTRWSSATDAELIEMKDIVAHRLRSRNHAPYLPKVPHIFSNPEAYYLLLDPCGKLL